MEGYAVVTSDGSKVGHVVGVEGDFLIVEHGHLRKTRNPLPRSFAHPNESEHEVTMTMPKELLYDAPKVDCGGAFDLDGASVHYGLADMYADEGDTIDEGVIAAERQRVETRESLTDGGTGDHTPKAFARGDEVERRAGR